MIRIIPLNYYNTPYKLPGPWNRPMSKQLTFVVMSATRTAADFDVLAAQAARLKARGRVEIGVSSLAERTASDIPPGGSPWHDYTSTLPALEKFFPHRDLVPFV